MFNLLILFVNTKEIFKLLFDATVDVYSQLFCFAMYN